MRLCLTRRPQYVRSTPCRVSSHPSSLTRDCRRRAVISDQPPSRQRVTTTLALSAKATNFPEAASSERGQLPNLRPALSWWRYQSRVLEVPNQGMIVRGRGWCRDRIHGQRRTLLGSSDSWVRLSSRSCRRSFVDGPTENHSTIEIC